MYLDLCLSDLLLLRSTFASVPCLFFPVQTPHLPKIYLRVFLSIMMSERLARLILAFILVYGILVDIIML
jgi:hypothetical protein